jgi:aminoglycoside 6-adenylyltransferase
MELDNMLQKNKVIKNLTNWAMENNQVRAMILTSSRANPHCRTDSFSDYDIELYVTNIRQFKNDKWLNNFGDVTIRWPRKPMATFDKEWITRLVLFDNEVRIDFQITSKKSINQSAYDDGYKVLVDKDKLTINLIESTFRRYQVKKPTKEEFDDLVNAFFWNATYVAKNLRRDELYYAKFMLDNILRFDDLQKMIEWNIAMQHDWSISTGKCGRLFKHYLSSKVWIELEATFSDAGIENNWRAFFKMIELFRALAQEVANNLGYEYPDTIDEKVTAYCKKVKMLKNIDDE